MASNKLFLYDQETNSAVCIAKGYQDAWQSQGQNPRMNEFFDLAKEFPPDIDKTRLELRTESDLPKEANILWLVV